MRKIDIISQLNMKLVYELSLAEHDGIAIGPLTLTFTKVWVADKALYYDLYTITKDDDPTILHKVAVRNNNTIELARFILDKLGKQTTMKLLELNAGE